LTEVLTAFPELYASRRACQRTNLLYFAARLAEVGFRIEQI
jgi:hypothetical protein